MKKLLLLTTIMMALTGCPGGDKNSRNYPNSRLGYLNGYGNCANCGINQAPMSQPVTASLPQATFTLNLLGDSFGIGAAAQMSNPIFSYQGAFTPDGNLYVSSDLLFGNCRLPRGNYTLRTVQAGIYDRGAFQVPAVELVGQQVRMIVGLTEGVVLTDGNGSAASFSAMMVGLQGPSAWMNMGYQQPYGPAGMQQTQCGDSVGVRF